MTAPEKNIQALFADFVREHGKPSPLDARGIEVFIEDDVYTMKAADLNKFAKPFKNQIKTLQKFTEKVERNPPEAEAVGAVEAELARNLEFARTLEGQLAKLHDSIHDDRDRDFFAYYDLDGVVFTLEYLPENWEEERREQELDRLSADWKERGVVPPGIRPKFELIYDYQKKDRVLKIYPIDAYAPDDRRYFNVTAWCYDWKKTRNIRQDRIRQAVDLDTGEALTDLWLIPQFVDPEMTSEPRQDLTPQKRQTQSKSEPVYTDYKPYIPAPARRAWWRRILGI